MENNKNLNEVIKNLIEENNKLKKENSELRVHNNGLTSEIIPKYEDALLVATNDYYSLKDKYDNLESHYYNRMNELNNLKDYYASYTEMYEILQNEKTELKKEVDFLHGYNNDLKKEVDKLSDENFNYYLDIEELNHIYEIDRTSLSDAKKENKQLKELIKNKDIYISELSNNFTELQKEKNLLLKSCLLLDKDKTKFKKEIEAHKQTIIQLYEIIKEDNQE